MLYIYSSYHSSAITYSYSDLEKTAVYIYPNSGFDYESFNQRLSDESLNASSAAYVFNDEFEDFKIENDALAQSISTHTELLCYPFDESENLSENTSLYSGENFSSSQLENGDDVCIICGAQYSDKVTVGETSYTVIGSYDLSDSTAYGFFPYSSAVKNNLTPDYAIVFFSGIDSTNYISVLKSKAAQLESLFPDCTVESIVHEKTLDGEKELDFKLMLLIFMTIAVLLTVCFTYSCIFELNQKKYAVYKLCGCTLENLQSICTGELFVIFSAAFLIASVLFIILFRFLLYAYEPVIIMVISFKDYLLCYLLELAAVMIIFLPFIKHKTTADAVSFLKESAAAD